MWSQETSTFSSAYQSRIKHPISIIKQEGVWALYMKPKYMRGVLAHTCDPSTWLVGTGGSEFKPDGMIQQDPVSRNKQPPPKQTKNTKKILTYGLIISCPSFWLLLTLWNLRKILESVFLCQTYIMTPQRACWDNPFPQHTHTIYWDFIWIASNNKDLFAINSILCCLKNNSTEYIILGWVIFS
jgi:hypothetical protein